jgi:glycosyltransferase involved in cell wall biosynthesis
MDLVSIIIPVYNINFFREAFNSAYNQSYKKKEIIIIYDNNKKEDFEKINKIIFKKKNTRLINNKKNLGAGIARNIGIKYSKGANTERNNRPDFIFPSIESYHDSSFSVSDLYMLGVKTTAKDRWRQVLSEADRISCKHLITLEPAITKNQTDEMIAQNLQLIIPSPLHRTYSERHLVHIINVKSFIDMF